MINQITNSPNTAVFAPLQSSSATYAITKPITESQKREIEQEKEQKSHNFGLKIASAALTTGFGILLLVKGLPKGARLKVNKFFKVLEEKSNKLSSKKADLTGIQNLYLGAINKTKKITQFVHGYFNFAPLKDAPPKVFAEKNPVLKKVWDGISNVFENISVKTSAKEYAKTDKNFHKLYEEMAKHNAKLSPKKAQEINNQIERLKILMDRGFGVEARSGRLSQAKKDMGNIHERFFERTLAHPVKMVKDKRFYTTFISEELATPAKMKMNTKLADLKKRVTFGVQDNYVAVKKQLNNLDSIFGLNVGVQRDTLLDARKALETYKKSGDIESRNAVIEKLIKLKTFSKDKNVTEEISNSIKMLRDTSKKGSVQNILAEYKKILPEEQYLKLEEKANKALASLDKSVDIEGDKLFDKIRDIQVGSAPMDLLGVLGSFAAVGLWLGKAEDKDERISAALKYGIPAVGAVITSLYCTIGLVSGGPALLIGLVSGQAINILGTIIDKKRKEYKQKPPTLADAAKILPNLQRNLNQPV